MFFQKEYIRESVALVVGATYRLDLPENGLLSSLFLKISTNNVSAFGQGEADWRPIDEISKIEILLDGSTPCKSLTGYQASAISFFDQGVMPPSTWRNYAGNSEVDYFLLNFGRFLHDFDYGLDLAKYNNVELRITNTADATDFVTMEISVLATYLREAPAGQFKGHIRSEEWRQWTGVQDATEYHTLPTEHIIRRIILQSIPAVNSDFVSDTGMHSGMDDIALSLDTGAVRVYKGGIDAIVRDNFYDQGKELIVGGQAYQLADDGVDTGLGYVQKVAIAPGSKDGAVAGTIPTLEAGTTIGVLKAETYEGGSPWLFIAGGLAPFYCAQMRFDHDPNPLTWLDPKNRGSVLLDIHTRNTASSDNGYNAVILDRLVR